MVVDFNETAFNPTQSTNPINPNHHGNPPIKRIKVQTRGKRARRRGRLKTLHPCASLRSTHLICKRASPVHLTLPLVHLNCNSFSASPEGEEKSCIKLVRVLFFSSNF